MDAVVNWDDLFVTNSLKILTKILGMYPYSQKSKFYNIYSVMVFVILITTSGIILHNRWTNIDDTSIIKINGVVLTLLFSSGILCAVKGFCSGRKVEELMENFGKIEKLIQINEISIIRKFSVKLILLNSIIVVLLIYDFVIGCIFYKQNFTWAVYHLNIYIMSLMAFQFSFHTFRLRVYLESVDFYRLSEWKKAFLAYQIICDNIELLNDIYGKQVAVMVASYIAGVLLDFDIVLKICTGWFEDVTEGAAGSEVLLSLLLDNILVLGMAPPVGIDLGTTFSSIAFYENGQEKVIGDRRGKKLIPSIVYVCPRTGNCFVGEAAYGLSAICPRNLLKDSKRLLGRKYDDEVVKQIIASDETCFSLVRGADEMVAYEVKVNGKALLKTPEEVSSEVLKYLKTGAEYYFNQPVTEAVISIPAYFSNAQRKATMKAATLAGLKVLRLITEPVAGALHYINDRNVYSKLMVFDWGGGTLDISFIDVKNKVFEVKAVYGDTRLGGRNIDEVLFKHFYVKVAKHPEKFTRRLLGECIQLKEHLSIHDEFTINFELYDGVNDLELGLTKEMFNEMNEGIFERLADIIKYGLSDVGLSSDAINGVVLVGGCSRIPKVRDILEKLFGKSKLRTDLNPDEAVVMGTCIQAAILKQTDGFQQLEKYQISEVTPLSIGVDTCGDLMEIVIPKNSKLPKTESINLVTVENNQDFIIFSIVEGERKNTKYNNKLGSFEIEGLPKRRAGDVQFNVTFNLNEDGILTVSASEISTGKMSKLVLMLSEFRLSETQLKLKFNEAEKAKHEDELFEKFIKRRNDLIEKCQHIIYDLNKINTKQDRDKIEEKCLNFISSAESLSFLELDLESMFVTLRDETYPLLKNNGIMLEITY